MCCLSEASSHFVVFVCVNPDRKPSRKMKRLNKNNVQKKQINDSTNHRFFCIFGAHYKLWQPRLQKNTRKTTLQAR